MINITVYTSLDKGVESIEAKAKELALLLSYYTGEKVDLNIIVTPLSSSDIIVPAVRVNDLFFDNLDVSEIIARIILENTLYSTILNNGIGVVPVI